MIQWKQSHFKMDSPNDKSHLVDWMEYRINTIINETLYEYLRKNQLIE